VLDWTYCVDRDLVGASYSVFLQIKELNEGLAEGARAYFQIANKL
jgi:hypothetical protein